LIVDHGLADYAKITGIDLSSHARTVKFLRRPSLNYSKTARRLSRNIAMAIGD
jgi:hypothetical protein